jgi:hypothetical protein
MADWWPTSAGAEGADAALVASIFWGLYESAEVRFVRRYLDPDLDCLELGSGIGLVSRVIAEALQPGRLLVCLEAREDLLACARENVDRVAQGLQCRYIAAVMSRNSSSAVVFPERQDWINARMGEGPAAKGEKRSGSHIEGASRGLPRAVPIGLRH